MTLTDPDTGTNSIVNTSDGKPGVDGAISELTNLYNTNTVLRPFAWSAPLQMAGQDWIDLIKTQSSVVTSVNGHTTASRADKYG
jgi:hypothetical protein